jgi:hypothetical protein
MISVLPHNNNNDDTVGIIMISVLPGYNNDDDDNVGISVCQWLLRVP